MRPVQLLSSALLCTSVVSAWPWTDNSLGDALGDLIVPHKRSPQRVTLGNSDAPTPNPSQSTNEPSTTASNSDQAENTNESQSGDATGSGSASASGSNTGSVSGSASRTSSRSGSGSGTNTQPTQTTFDPRLPAGGIAMITPNSRSSASYYKIGDFVTFAWNYTSLSVTPSAIDILASCSLNQQIYTLATNQTVGNATGAVTWDTGNYQATATVPLLTETYTLIIHDAQKDVTDTPRAGYLGTFSQFTFGMYAPQAYTPPSKYVCVTCSGAMTAIEKQSLAVVSIFATLAVLGATWFTGLGAVI
ncbi:Mitochondrial genome maintenance protein mgm101 [Sphaceloma murrayae]|uniref:Mitochondrial genome maintenance protein mgm101 n=1 Tax=Sphaceloma murrayae TaxID=2082308 RepID=A0A2K1QQD4_9PEZI|nr:Mitochondrial genome maintenance protein mgm101 [Sphaceloma murrayae]